MKNLIEKGDYLDILLRSKKTVFSVNDIALLWPRSSPDAMQVRLNYYVGAEALIRLRRGIYVKDQQYDKYELASSILSPSYVSFETVLASAGVTFQYYEQIFVASYVKRDIICGGTSYTFQTIKRSALVNPLGVNTDPYSIASPERAFLDTIYRSKDYYFDNLLPLNWDMVFEILPIYEDKTMIQRVQRYYDHTISTA